MELQQMRYVVAVAETANFTRAAERCHVVQSALSHQIARLERELGARLFDRTSRRVRLTPAGEAFLPAARQALEAAGRAEAEVAAATGEVRGRLAIGAIATFGGSELPRALRTFHADHPKVEITLRAGSSEELERQVRDGGLDLAVVGRLPDQPSPGLRQHVLTHDRLVAIVAPDHPLAGAAEVALSGLAGETFIDFPAGGAGRAQADRAFAAAGVRREVPYEVGSVEFMARLVRHGLGVGLVPEVFVPELTGVRAVPIGDPTAREERLVWNPQGPSPAAAALMTELGVPPPR